MYDLCRIHGLNPVVGSAGINCRQPLQQSVSGINSWAVSHERNVQKQSDSEHTDACQA